jgi:lipoate-protein ligase A
MTVRTNRSFDILRHTDGRPEHDLALEEALYRALDEAGGPPVLRLWLPVASYVVLGLGRAAGSDLDLDACKRDGVPVLRRFSGGGTVLHSPGQVCFSFYAPYDLFPEARDLRGSYAFFASLIAGSLRGAVPGLALEEPSDIAIGGRKVSGNAQRRGRRVVLHHGTLLVDCDTGLFARYLNEPGDRPAYRGARTHGEFVTTFAESGSALTASEAAGKIASELGNENAFRVSCGILTCAESLAVGKYSDRGWIFRL